MTAVATRPPVPDTTLEQDQPRNVVRPRRLGMRRADLALFALCAIASFCLVWVLYDRLTPASGALGFGVLWFALFLPIQWLAVRELEDGRAATDRVLQTAIGVSALVVVVTLASIVIQVIAKGIVSLRPSFFTETMQGTGPLSKATDGGALHSMIGTLQQVGIAAMISVPLGIATAVYLNEVRGRIARPVRLFVDAMSGVPSIVAGLFIYAVWVLRFGFSGIAAAFALSVLMLPTITRTSEEVLRLVPGGLREASTALGASEWRTTWSVVLPTARSGLVTAVLLGLARAIGDTAALIATAAGFDALNANPLRGQQDSMSLFVYKQVRIGLLEAQTQRAWTGALVLLALVFVLFSVARFVSRPASATTRRPRRLARRARSEAK